MNKNKALYPKTGMFVSAIPFAAMAIATPAYGQAVNSATVSVPSGAFEVDATNNTATDSDTIFAVLVAANDSATGINGMTGATAVVNAFTADTVNGVAASPSNAVLSLAPGASVPTGLSFDTATGNVDVAAGTAAGTYSFDYQICEALNPTNCRTATISVTVTAAPIAAEDDSAEPLQGGVDVPNVINIFDNDTLNDARVTISDISVTVLAPATHPGISLDILSGNVSVESSVPAGDYSIEYRICENLNPTNCDTANVTLSVLQHLSNVQGTVFTDMNSDRHIDEGDLRRAGWTVELMHDDVMIGTTISDASGGYQFTGVPSGDGYSVRFKNPENGVVYGILSDLSLEAATTVVDQDLPIDPSGVIYNSITRSPVAGSIVNLVDANGNVLPEACYLDPSQMGQMTGISGEYRFDIIPGAAAQCPNGEARYTITVEPPANFSFVSTVLLPQPDALNPTGQPGPYRVSTSIEAPIDAEPVYYLSFLLGSGDPDVINNHIPIDPFLTRTPLTVTKTSTKRSASTGDLVPYEITVRNNESAQRAGVNVVDILPSGMKYVTGTASVDGVAFEPVVNERQVTWNNQRIPANGAVSYRLTLVVGAGVTTGEKVNTGLARDEGSGTEISNRGTAVVTIVPSSVFDCSELIGKVFEDRNGNGYQDEGEPGIAGVRLATVNGQLITTDGEGRYHIACAAVPNAQLGSNYVLKLDTRTIPLGWQLTTDNPRSIRLTRGKMGELNFGVAPPATEKKTITTHEEGE